MSLVRLSLVDDDMLIDVSKRGEYTGLRAQTENLALESINVTCALFFFFCCRTWRQACPERMFCPTGSSNTTACPGGYYCPAETASPVVCPKGYYCPFESSEPILCSLGSFCPEGSEIFAQCPLGWNGVLNSSNIFSKLEDACEEVSKELASEKDSMS